MTSIFSRRALASSISERRKSVMARSLMMAEREYIFESKLPAYPIADSAIDMTLPEFVLDGAEQDFDRVAIVDSSDGRQYTYSEFRRLVKNVAAGLASLGIHKGDVVCFVLPNVAEYFILVFGVMSVGAIFSGCNPYAHPSEILKQVLSSDAKLLITDPPTLRKVADIEVPIVMVGGEAMAGTITVQTLLTADGAKAPAVSMSPDDVCLLPYSSGTTGLPKGVMITHRNIIANLCQTLCVTQCKFSSQRMGPHETVLGLMPFFHIYGISGLGCATMRNRGTIVVMERYEIRRLLQVLLDFEVTSAPLVPPIILSLLKSPVVAEFDLTALKLSAILCAAAPLSPELQQAFEDKFPGVLICQAYGLTEYSCVTLSHVPPPYGLDVKPSKKGSVGFLMPGTQIKFVDLSTGKSVPAHAHGELCVRGPTIMKGYYKNAKATESIIDADGWLHTGDVGYIDDDGDVYIVERVKELIKYKGFQVPPAELEAILISHSAVTDAAVVGIPDDEAGEIPAACIVLSPNAFVTEKEVKDYVNSQVASYKKVRFVEQVPKIPKSTSGKILRRLLKDQLILKYRAQTQRL
ncbi:4-coumarate--CoA ligase [Marchantia polymorpha subsp. ruderalis]|uniref:4-coumarate--CoA ligase n=2 Tax=Marchantia polymorpha TaxID=3197 RepID=A0AAF6AP33_MARPO|nr:hypothetical protein MARPO_0014s0059 [Marchantia polymorpha]BBM98203.1 hypothetical protein Mp_1g11670 [Marchantia polymorpha subsp. ruderalis]|eukprot:PTQ45517.1 hypothetical protein MARPO_0014s0059 [Marchantia polymorpha]